MNNALIGALLIGGAAVLLLIVTWNSRRRSPQPTVGLTEVKNEVESYYDRINRMAS